MNHVDATPSTTTAGGPERDWLLAETNALLDGARVTSTGGAGFGWLGDAGTVDASRGRPLWITTRMTHCYALGSLLGRDGDDQLLDHGVQSLLTPSDGAGSGFWDATNDGWFDQPTGAGDKAAYGHAFVVLAGASATVAGHPRGRELLERALDVSLSRFWDADAGAVVENWDAAWTGTEAYRGANANMHTVEAYLAAADATGDNTWRQRALQICDRLINRGARSHDWRVPEHFDPQWHELPEYNVDAPAHPFRPYGVTPGHGLEWARLLLHLDAGLAAAGQAPPEWLRPAAVGLYDRAMADGWDAEHGGICYTTDWSGRPVVTEHFSWVVCEGAAAASVLAKVTGEQRFSDDVARLWAYARSHYIDDAPGWLMEVAPDGTPSTVTWQGRPDIYHAVQACLIPLLAPTPTFAKALAGQELSG